MQKSLQTDPLCGMRRLKQGISSVAIAVVALALSMPCRSVKANDQRNPPPPTVPLTSLDQSGNATATTNAVESILQLPNGTVYVGEVADGLPQGLGTVTDKYGSKQYGEWHKGNAYKISGKSVYPDGTVEIGTWNADGSKCGGTITWKNGQVY